ncbi:dyslexia-associated protein KIAA0319-like protein [Aedes aegypti]|uniref:PKD/Chitinase domain-containing protein n=1 Tax=Aedes aegypti TaxID=7159 RepID=A0A6I8TEP1_AEDAE|nr:dyslexia-associated protein KIAA0319-like protein [Aedes aegypti]
MISFLRRRRNNIARRIMDRYQLVPVLIVASLLILVGSATSSLPHDSPTAAAGLTASSSSGEHSSMASGGSRRRQDHDQQQQQQQQQQSIDAQSQETKLCPLMMRHVFDGYAPIGNSKAGNYSEVPEALVLNTCVQGCCVKGENCTAAFMFNRTCYHVKCWTSELCIPVKKANLAAKLKMMLVNPVGDDGRTWPEILESAVPQETRITEPDLERFDGSIMNKLKTMYNLERNREELSERIYDMPLDKQVEYELGKYPASYMYGDDPMMAESKFYPEHKCVVGLDSSCPEHETCVGSSKSFEGICDCMEHYTRNSEQLCVRIEQSRAYDIPQTLTAQKLIMNNVHSEAGEIEEENARPPPPKNLTVSVVSKDIRLPNNEAVLTAFVIPDEATSQDKYTYSWSLISQPSKGDSNATITDQTKSQAKLSKLTEGLYRFKVTVTGQKGYGEAYPNITVLPEQKINKPPDVVITPMEQTVKLPNHKAILDGSASTDDDKITSWQWELVQGPLGYQPELPAVSTLQLNDLEMPGKYTFKLTVIDSEKLSNSTTATIEVLKEIDYPPEANAGQNVIVYLPNNKVTLNGSLSKDDHGIVAWEWTKDSKDQSKAVDMQNTRTPYLQLSNLEEGVYVFELKVTDANNQSSTSTVHVFVKMPTNMPPVANAGANYTLNLPQNWATLNGSESKDDLRITSWNWRQISGPNTATILNGNNSIANATSLTIGDYLFELTVTDEANNNDTSRVKITVVQERNTAPVANAGGDQSVTLPTNVIVLNGTRSNDDLGIANYSWTRESGSLAIGTIVDESDRKPVLILTNIVPGRYVFKLTVTDGQGLSGSDTVSVIVHPDPLVMSLVELTLTMEATVLTQSELDSLQQKLVLLIGDNNARLHVRDLKIEHKTGQVVIVFYVEKNEKDKPEIMPALEVEKILKEKFWRDYTILGTSVAGIRTTICQNDCSGHGVCNAETRDCMCQSFWMPDIFFFWGVAEANCDWSILYVIIGVFIVFLVLSGICWGITCLCRRSSKPRTRSKTQKYSLLGTQDDELPSFTRTGTTMSDSETDSDVLFESRSKQNGIPPGRVKLANGDVRNGHAKYNTTRLGRRIKT